VIVIDGIFRPDFIDVLDRFLRKLPFSLADYDTKGSRHVLHWFMSSLSKRSKHIRF
jgi:hypothetical protein